MKQKISISVFIFALIIVANLQIKNVSGASGTYYPIDTDDDGFITQIGNHFRDTPYLPLQSATTDIISGLRFQSLTIPQDAKINNATLFVRTLHTYDPGVVLVTIYGINENDAYAFNNSGDFTRPYTSNHVNWNVSLVNGVAWHNVSVTEIVQEIISRYGWRSGNDLAFIILADSGEPRREFASIDNNIVWRPQLEITWDVEPTPPSDEAEPPYNDTSLWEWEYENTSQGIDIWKVTSYGFPSFQAFSIERTSNHAWYINSADAIGDEKEWDASAYLYPLSGAVNSILGLDPWTLIFADKGAASVYYSDDEFLTYSSEDPNNQYNLSPWIGNLGSMALDELDNETIHLVYTSPTPAFPGVYNVIYTNFTIDTITETLSWSSTYTNITQTSDSMMNPVVYCQENGSLHVVYYGHQAHTEDQVWYRRRHENGTWLPQVRVSDTDVGGYPHNRPDVIANEDTGDALVVWDYDGTNIYWDIVFPNNTDTVDRDIGVGGGKLPAMVNDRINNVAQLVFEVISGNPWIAHTTKTIDNSSAWAALDHVSPGGQKHYIPDIGIDPINGSLQAIWWNDWNVYVSGNYWRLGDNPTSGSATRITVSNGRHNAIEVEFTRTGVDTVYFIAYPNGTLIDDEPPCDTLECAEDIIEDILGVDPEDPQTDDYGTALTKNRWKTFVFVVGMIMFLGTPSMAMISRASIGRWYLVLFVSLCGLSILWSLIYM